MAAAVGMAAWVSPYVAGGAQSKAGSGEVAAAARGGLPSFAGLRMRSCIRGGEKRLCFKRANWQETTKQRKEEASVDVQATSAVQEEATFADVPHITNWLPDLPVSFSLVIGHSHGTLAPYCLGLLLIAQQGMGYNVLTQLIELYLHLSIAAGSSGMGGSP